MGVFVSEKTSFTLTNTQTPLKRGGKTSCKELAISQSQRLTKQPENSHVSARTGNQKINTFSFIQKIIKAFFISDSETLIKKQAPICEKGLKSRLVLAFLGLSQLVWVSLGQSWLDWAVGMSGSVKTYKQGSTKAKTSWQQNLNFLRKCVISN